MDTRFVLGILVGLASSVFAVSAVQADAAEDEARLTYIMERMDAGAKRMAVMENTLLMSQSEIGRETADLVAAQLGTTDDLIDGRDAEFGRAMINLVRTFQMRGSYDHKANDSLVKRDLEWLQYLKDKGLMADAVRHDIAIKTPLFQRRGEWIHKTANLEMGMDSITGATCFRDMVVVEGFTRTPLSISYISPYKSVLDAGTKRGMFNLTEQEIHENFTVPTVEGYAKVLGIDVKVSEWNDDRAITISIVPTPEYQALQARRTD